MKTCGIDIKGNEAIIVCLEGSSDQYKQVFTELKKIKLEDARNQEAVQSFYKKITDFFSGSNFDKIGIKERATKGKFAGGPTSFKIEGLIQNVVFPVILLHPQTINAKIKSMVLDTTKINQYQSDALKVAYFLLDT